MSSYGIKYTCWKCTTKFYDLQKPEPRCPKCKANPEDDPNKGRIVALSTTPDFSDEVGDEELDEQGDDEELEEDLYDENGSDSDEDY